MKRRLTTALRKSTKCTTTIIFTSTPFRPTRTLQVPAQSIQQAASRFAKVSRKSKEKNQKRTVCLEMIYQLVGILSLRGVIAKWATIAAIFNPVFCSIQKNNFKQKWVKAQKKRLTKWGTRLAKGAGLQKRHKLKLRFRRTRSRSWRTDLRCTTCTFRPNSNKMS